MAALVVGVSVAGAAIANTAGKVGASGPLKSGVLPRISYFLLWALIFGTALGVLGGA